MLKRVAAAFVMGGLFLLGLAYFDANADEAGNGPAYVPTITAADASVQVIGSDGSGGSGTIISGGYILTAYHVVQGSNDFLVRLATDYNVPATVISSNSLLDVAILQPVVPLANALAVNCHPVEQGEHFTWVGNPVGFENNLGQGYISTLKGRSLKPWQVGASAAANHGDSGSGIVNDKNEVRGIIVAGVQSGDGIAGNTIIVPSFSFCPLIISLYMGG